MTTPLDRYLAMLPRNPSGGGMAPHAAIIWDHLLSKQAEQNIVGHLAEIGVFKGFGASLMAGYMNPNEVLTLIDLMCGIDYSSEAITEIAGAAALKQIKFHQIDSLQLRHSSSVKLDSPIRFFHIDGEHSYDAVMNDLHLAIQLMAPSGVIVVDDFFSAASPAITHAVFDFAGMSSHNFSLFLMGYNKAYLCSNRWLGFYRDAIKSLPERLESFGFNCQLAAGGFAFERTYAGISERASENRFQLIGRYVPETETFLSGTNRF